MLLHLPARCLGQLFWAALFSHEPNPGRRVLEAHTNVTIHRRVTETLSRNTYLGIHGGRHALAKLLSRQASVRLAHDPRPNYLAVDVVGDCHSCCLAHVRERSHCVLNLHGEQVL